MSFNAQGEYVDDNSDYGLVREWCPTCEPEGIPEPWTPKYCGLHWVKFDGAADACVREDGFLSGTAEAGGVENRAFCDLVRSSARQTA